MTTSSGGEVLAIEGVIVVDVVTVDLADGGSEGEGVIDGGSLVVPIPSCVSVVSGDIDTVGSSPVDAQPASRTTRNTTK